MITFNEESKRQERMRTKIRKIKIMVILYDFSFSIFSELLFFCANFVAVFGGEREGGAECMCTRKVFIYCPFPIG